MGLTIGAWRGRCQASARDHAPVRNHERRCTRSNRQAHSASATAASVSRMYQTWDTRSRSTIIRHTWTTAIAPNSNPVVRR